ncbi:hypothetical protein E1B28_010428 [Marasmius oreades]|uniref:Uncharacterized protein n=1 Tax=Marasmius oreades TaxID=181124 RepID=A0A9P7RXR6_9AGAR|nr:uncharacterized protein E1B28_010428 [Marasmius oreades]KAG7091390.1 hypothetical protein E1B28_010428 [Marasmius oreades]
MSSRKNYQGLFRKTVIAFDVGTTYSGASYAVLDPGSPPIIEGVTKFPGQGSVGGDSKIPSIIYYDWEGNVQAVGTEATEASFLELADEQEYQKVEWFKLHLRPKGLETSQVHDSDLPPLPGNKAPIDVFADFLRYLYQCTIDYIKKNRGADFFSSLEHNIDYVLTHPNGWEGPQQAQMRQAAVRAGLVSAENAESRLQFVTEGEASLHYCINKGVMRDEDIEPEKGLIIVDAGGGTIDLSAYKKTASGLFEETARTQCRLQGSVYVTRRATAYLKDKLKASKYGTRQDIEQIADVFDKVTKLSFRNEADTGYIPFGSPRDKDLSVGISRGQMKIPGEIMKLFFAPSLGEIINAIQEQMREAQVPITSVFLVGGFAASDWMFDRLKNVLEQLNLSLSRPDGFVNKAVADGAVSFFLDHMVSARVSRFTYGIECNVPYQPSKADHKKRSHTIFVKPSGKTALPGHFSTILPKGSRVQEETEFRRPYYQESAYSMSLMNISAEILCYKGHDDAPEWLDINPKRFPILCNIEATVSEKDDLIKECHDASSGRTWFEAHYEVVLLFGLTELKAQICWKSGDGEKRSPASVVYDQNNEMR